MFLFPCLFRRLQHTVDRSIFVAGCHQPLCFALCFHFSPAAKAVAGYTNTNGLFLVLSYALRISLSAVRPRVTWGLFVRHANHFGHALTYDGPFNWLCAVGSISYVFFCLKNKIGPSSDFLQYFRRAFLWSHLFPIVWVINFLRTIMPVLSTRLSLPRFFGWFEWKKKG